MWVITQDGFYSAVAHHADAELMTVRCRAVQDANALAKRVNDWRRAEEGGRLPAARKVEVIAYRSSDYPWRVEVRREEWARYLTAAVQECDYTNFKNRITAKQGHKRHDIYSSVWGVLLRIEKLAGAMKDHDTRAIPHPRWARRTEVEATDHHTMEWLDGFEDEDDLVGADRPGWYTEAYDR